MAPLNFSVAAGGQVKVTESLGQQPEEWMGYKKVWWWCNCGWASG